jgi:hypothetical protein
LSPGAAGKHRTRPPDDHQETEAAVNIGRIVREVEAKPMEQPNVAPLEPEIVTPVDEPERETSGTA